MKKYIILLTLMEILKICVQTDRMLIFHILNLVRNTNLTSMIDLVTYIL